MNYFGKIYSTISQAYSEINPATLTGSIDVIVVEQEDGSYLCSPFHVRFGKMGVLRSREKIVDIEINNCSVDIHMKLGDSGEAYFLEECDDDDVSNEEVEDEPSSPTDVQSNSNISNDGYIADNSINESPSNNCDNQQINNDPKSNELITPKSEPASGMVTPQVNQKRVRRKKKSRALSKQSSVQSDSTKVDQSESCAEFDRESIDEICSHSKDSSETVAHHYTDSEQHPFSDSEVNTIHHTHQKYKHDSTFTHSVSYDCKSDTEYEVTKYENPKIDKISWDWGELPKELPNEFKDNKERSKLEMDGKTKSSMLGGVLNFIIKDKDMAEDDKGIYLDDLDPNDMNPEVTAKYFSKFAPRTSSLSQVRNNISDEDIESGTGPSLSNSPNSTEFHYPQPDFSGFDERNFTTYDLNTFSKIYYDMSMSLCGGIENLFSNPSDSEHFLQSIISFDDFSENPLQILENPNLVIRMGGKYYNWKMASSIILSLLMFQRPLPKKTFDNLKDMCIPKKKNTAQNSWRSWFSSKHSGSEPDDPNMANGSPLENKVGSKRTAESNSLNSTISGDNPKSATKAKNNNLEYTSDDETVNIVLSSNKVSTTSTPNHTNADGNHPSNLKKKYRKVLRLNSDVIKSLNLQPNSNDVMFSVTTAYQGTTICRSKIFLWRYDDQIIISDIDGTITRSDVLGHILPMIGKDWAQVGVTKLYSNIESNGYKFLYLSARAIGQAKATRDYLQQLQQDGIGLPDGPLLLSPTSLFSALHREVIEKKPEEFKIGCLKDIQTLFPQNPFFAGFGNKKNDNVAYNAVDIDCSRIFTINPKGEVKLERIMSFKSSYIDLSQIVDQMFPPLHEQGFNDGFSSFMFWRPDIPVLDDQEIVAKK
ncbi:Lipin-3 [Blomia tropicalis]|nr:Lipin-3 [Blomia tropicalis]